LEKEVAETACLDLANKVKMEYKKKTQKKLSIIFLLDVVYFMEFLCATHSKQLFSLSAAS
jgi:hypothetical protein